MTRSVLAAAMAALLITGAAAAQPQPEGAPGARFAQFRERMQAHRAQRLADLKAILRIRPDQETAFSAFAQSMHPSERPEQRRPDRGPAGPTLTTPERLARVEQRMAEHQARFRARLEATRTFYAALSPEQQRTFDALQRMRGGPGGGFGGGRHKGLHPGEGRFGPPPPGPGERG